MMVRYVVIDEDGGIKQQGVTTRDALTQIDGAIEVEDEISYLTHRFVDGSPVAYTNEQRTERARMEPVYMRWNARLCRWEDTRTDDLRVADAWALIKQKRNSLLDATDWVVIRAIDRAEPVLLEWCEYRQALRDITLQTDPFNIIWPTPPLS